MTVGGLDRYAAGLRKGWRVVAFRGWQEARLALLRASGAWPRLAGRAEAAAASGAAAWLTGIRAHGSLVAPDGWRRFRAWAAEHPQWRDRLAEQVSGLEAGRFEIFDASAAFSLSALPWDCDWRFDHRWEPRYFRRYQFNEDGKPTPYDVKWPWELSRLGALVPLTQHAALDSSGRSGRLARALLTDWERRNPIAWSVNWVPMEASVRGVTLALGAELLAADPSTSPELIEPWLRLAIQHGEFVARTVEWTDVNNNHYMANVVALVVLGAMLEPVYGPAREWRRFAERRLWREILVEFLPDGVNYEMATGYHRLVTELCLLALLAADRAGRPAPAAVRQRLTDAVHYTAAYMRPDGWAPAVGDNDSARVLMFDRRHTRDHGELLALGAAMLGVPTEGVLPESAAPVWLLGATDAPPAAPRGERLRSFPAGGVYIARHQGSFLFADVGGVGLRGRGGHGHNDTLGFELHIAGEAVFIDPGVPCYSGDRARHRAARATSAHNLLRIDGEEQAPISDTWRIGNDAAPTLARSGTEGAEIVITGEHRGYARLPDPVTHRRTWRFDPAVGRLSVQDEVDCRGAHQAERFLHLAPDTRVDPAPAGAMLHLSGGGVVRCRWDSGSELSRERAVVSESYGSERPAEVLVLRSAVAGPTTFSLVVEPASASSAP